MLKLLRYLKPYILPLLLAVVLLYGQAMADLELPDYMSDLVNVGVQQNGIEKVAPISISETDFDKLVLLVDADNAEVLKDNYHLVMPEDSDYNEVTHYFDGGISEPVYALNGEFKAVSQDLEIAVSKAILLYSQISQSENAPVLDQLAMLPEAQLEMMLEQANTYFDKMSDSMLIQTGAQNLKTYYDSVGFDIQELQNDYIFRVGGMMLLITLLGAIAAIAVGLLSARIAAGTSRDLRKDVFSKVSQFTNKEFDNFSTASLITRSTNDITQIQNLLVMMIRMLLLAPIMGIGGVIKALEKSSSMSWIIALAVIILLGVIALVFSIALPKFKAVQKLVDRINLVMRENLTGMMVIRAFNTQKFEENRFDKANSDLMETNLFVNRLMVSVFPVMMLIMNGVSLAIIWVGAHQIQEATMQVGDMIAFMQYALQIIMSFLMMSVMFIMIPRASVSAQRIAEVLDMDISVKEASVTKPAPKNGRGHVSFVNVSFKFPGAEENMLKNISFEAPAGQTTAIIGSTGSGKSTIVNLLPRFYDTTEGEILIDGVPIREMAIHELRDIIGYVPQKSTLFTGTIRSNMQFADENASEADILKAIEVAQAKDIVAEKEEGLESEIAQGGKNVSGGQKQRFSIARALVKKPKVFVFDDSFSALDFKTDSALRKALKEYTGASTVILVAQRIATIRNAEQIIVLDDGKVVGIGTHDVLIQNCKTYQEIAQSQLSAEELS